MRELLGTTNQINGKSNLLKHTEHGHCGQKNSPQDSGMITGDSLNLEG